MWTGKGRTGPHPVQGGGDTTNPPALPPAGVHVFGLCATALVTDVIQLATGYHAPFFLTVCKPNYTLLGTPCDANPYITQDICSGTDKHAILSARYVPGRGQPPRVPPRTQQLRFVPAAGRRSRPSTRRCRRSRPSTSR